IVSRSRMRLDGAPVLGVRPDLMAVKIAKEWVHQKKGPTVFRRSGLYDDCRQRPTLPHSFPCSTIGGIRLNFRVRNGNGCDPDPMTTGILVCLGFPPSLAAQASEGRPLCGLPTVAPKAQRWDRPRQFQRATRLRAKRLGGQATEYPANGS